MKVVVVASGKGGTGKTSLVAGVGAALSLRGRRVLLVDGDTGLRNLDIVLGVSDRMVFSFADVAAGIVPLDKAAAAHPELPGLFIITAPSGSVEIEPAGFRQMIAQAEQSGFDAVFLDCPAGVGREIGVYASAATEAVVVSATDPMCLRGAERAAAALREWGVEPVRLVLNRIRKKLIRRALSENIDDAMDAVGLPLLGCIPEDEQVIVCANQGKSAVLHHKKSAAKAYANIAARLDGGCAPLLRL